MFNTVQLFGGSSDLVTLKKLETFFYFNVIWQTFIALSFCRFFFVHQSHSPLCSFFTNTKSTKNILKTVTTYYFTVT